MTRTALNTDYMLDPPDDDGMDDVVEELLHDLETSRTEWADFCANYEAATGDIALEILRHAFASKPIPGELRDAYTEALGAAVEAEAHKRVKEDRMEAKRELAMDRAMEKVPWQ